MGQAAQSPICDTAWIMKKAKNRLIFKYTSPNTPLPTVGLFKECLSLEGLWSSSSSPRLFRRLESGLGCGPPLWGPPALCPSCVMLGWQGTASLAEGR